MKTLMKQIKLLAAAAFVMAPSMLFADTISPVSYTDTLAVGESVTIRKTVVIEDAPASSALLDVMFVFDVTGSMGGEIAAAKAAANGILAALDADFDLQSGTGWYSDPGFNGVHVDLNSGNTAAASGINDMWGLGSCTVTGVGGVGCGGDFPEKGYAAISDAADNATWRAGSNRVIIALGDATFKAPPSEAATIASLAAADADLIGISYNSGFAADIAGLGGTSFAGGTSSASVAAAIAAGITSTFATYTEVTVDDLGGSGSGVGVSVACVSAAAGGSCSGADAVGSWDRSADRTFEFDVTFTGLEEGVHAFDTFALVDGGIVATEADLITVAVPEPGSLLLLGMGLLGMGIRRRRAI